MIVCAGTIYCDLIFTGLTAPMSGGREVFADSLAIEPGGIAKVAVALVRAGHPARIHAPLSDGVFGRLVRRRLEEEGVDVSRCPPLDGPQPLTVAVPWNGERAFVTHAPVEPFYWGDVADADAVIGIPRPDAPPHHHLYLDADDRTAEPPPPGLARVLFANRKEAETLTGRADPEEAARFLAPTAQTVVVKLGADGALALTDGRIVRAEAPPVRAVDTTGAGNVFVATYVAADLAGHPMEERLAEACRAAADSVTRPGTVGG